MKRRRAGRVLRLKVGYNPNSSSIGTIVFAMPAALLGLTVAFGAAAGLLSAGLLRTGEGSSDEAEPAPDEDGAKPTVEPTGSSDVEPS